MGTTPKPLALLVHPSLEGLEGFQTLRDQGHWITSSPVSREGTPLGPWDFDGVISPTAWRMTPDLMKYLAPMLKELRASKYPVRVNRPPQVRTPKGGS